MPSLRNLACSLIALLLLAVPARATWSILIIDLTTGEVAVGIATCLTGFDLRPSTVVVVPGYGVAAAQSYVGPMSLREIIRNELQNGTPASQILNLLAAADPSHQSRQYGIAGLASGTATFTGSGAGLWAGGLTGQVGNLVYTVQGNVLTGQPVILAAETAIQTTPGSVADKLMAAMEAARSMGGDGRCSCTTGGPTSCGSPPPFFAKSSHIALMIVSRPSDIDAPCVGGSGGCAAGDYYLDLNIANQTANDPDPVIQLQALFNTWRAQQVGRPDHYRSVVAMSGSQMRANGIDSLTGTVWLQDAQGFPLGNTLPVTVQLSNRSTVTGVTFSPVVPEANGSYSFTMQGDLDAGEAIIDVAVHDGVGRVGIWPQPVVMVNDAFGPCGTGAISDGGSGVIDALRIGGSAGEDRVVEIGLGQPFILTIDPPVGAPSTPPVGAFALWAHLGLPHPNAVLPLGANAGSLCFRPYPLDPMAPTLLVADSFGLGGYIAATRAPWTLGFPGVARMLDVTLQAAMAVDLQGTLATTNAIMLRMTSLPAPIISSIAPSVAPAGATVTISGSDFLNGVELRVGGNPTPIQAWSPTALTFVMPAGHGCDTAVTVNNLGTASVSSMMNATPNVTFTLNTSGPAAGGQFYVISGQNLGASTVTFNGLPMTVTQQTSATIVGTTPPGTPGPATVIVSNSLGCQTTVPYTYQ